MCAGYGITPGGPNSNRSERRGVLAFLPEGASSDPSGDVALLERWEVEQAGEARITGRNARNLNPIVMSAGGNRHVELAWWWLHVGGAPAKFTAFNSRADRLLASWRTPFQHRALAPADWYIEKGVRFELPSGEPFGIASITSPVGQRAEDGLDAESGARSAADLLRSYSIVTRDAVAGAAEVHDRMPLVLPTSLYDEWLDPERAGDAELVKRAVAASEELSREFVAVGAKRKRQNASTTEQPKLF